MKQRVVIIDDSKFLITQLREFFEKEMGFDVVAEGVDGNEAVALYRMHHPALITIDITMPNKDGKQAIKEILSEFPDANILIISAIRGTTMLECMELGAKTYVEKPLKFGHADFITDFKASVNEALQ